MRQVLMDRLNKLQGKKEVLDPKANCFPRKNEAYIRSEEVDKEIEFLNGVLGFCE